MDYAASKEIIHQTSILSQEDTAFIDQNIGEIQDNWEKRQKFRTETEMRVSVLQDMKFPTPAAKYWQCVREQSVFYEQLVMVSFAYRRNQIKVQRIEALLSGDMEEYDRLEAQIDLEEAQFTALGMEQDAHDRMREIRLWATLMAEQIDKDPSFDRENVDTHQLISYSQRFEAQAQNMGDHATPGERNNLLGQLQTTRRRLVEAGVIKLDNKGQPIALQRKQ